MFLRRIMIKQANWINVVNRHLEKSIETNIANQFGKLEGKATVYTVNSGNISDENSVNQQKVDTQTKEISVKENGLVYSFPAHSFTMIKVKLEK